MNRDHDTRQPAESAPGGIAESHSDIPRWPFVEQPEVPENNNNQSRPTTHQRNPSHPHPTPTGLGRRRHVLRYWVLEIITVVFAFLLMAAIIVLLVHYDGQYMPEWPFQINLNSAIAFLTTFLRAAILAAVAEIIGQIKWTWFTERTRPLHHLQDFDSASRSVLGSLRLLAVVMWHWSFTSAGLLGVCASFVTIASLAVGPFTQQAIKTATCPQLQRNARSAIPAANYVPGTSAYYRIGAGLYELEVDMKSAMIQGMTDPDGKDNEVEVTCSSGNCTWPDWGTGITHSSIGLCSACLDTTDWVSEPNLGGNLTLPDEGSFINFNPGGENMWIGYSNLSAYSQLFDDDFATAAAVSVSNFSILLTTTSPCTITDNSTGEMTCPHRVSQSNNTYYSSVGDYIAASCILYPCVKQYHARYQNNTLNETIVKTAPAVPNTDETTDTYTFTYNYTASISPCVLDNGTWYTYENQSSALHVPGRTWANMTVTDSYKDSAENISVPNACLYKMDGIFFSAIGNFLSSTMFMANCYYDSLQSGHLNCGDSWWLTPLWQEKNATFSTVNAALEDFATVVTNKFRMTGTGPDILLGGGVTREEVYGSVYESTTCTYFDRRWVSLPVILVVICAILLAWIAIKNYRDPEQPVWKGSILPLMFFGLHAPGEVSQTPASSSMAYDKERLDRSATFFKKDGRAAPELDRIQDEAGKLWVRFHGGLDPGFMDLGSRTVARNTARPGDAESSAESLVPRGGIQKRESLWPDSKGKSLTKS